MLDVTTSGVKLLTEESSFTSGVDGRTVLDICKYTRKPHFRKKIQHYILRLASLKFSFSSVLKKITQENPQTHLLDFLSSRSSMCPPRPHFTLVVGSTVIQWCRLHVTRPQLQIRIYAKPIKIIAARKNKIAYNRRKTDLDRWISFRTATFSMNALTVD